MGIRALAIAASCVAGVCVAVATPAGTAPSPRLSWVPCSFDKAQQCADLDVPVDYAKPGLGKVTLALTKRPAVKPQAKRGVLVFAGTQALTTTQRLRDHFDIVTFAARKQNICRVSYPDIPLFPADEQQLQQVRAGMRDWYLACDKVVGPAFRNDNSAVEARDIDAIRAAMGERQISLMHTWENEITGQMYAELFPGRVRAMVLDGNLDHSVTTADEYLTLKAKSVQSSFDGFADWCDRTPDCALYGMDTRKVYDELRGKAEQGLLGTVSVAALSARVGGSTDYPEIYFHRLGEYYRTVYDMSGGANRAAQATQALPPAPSEPGDKVVKGFRRGLSYGSFCQDWKLTIDDYAHLTRIVQAQNEAAPNIAVNLNQWLNVLSCMGWPFETGNPQHRLAITRPLPVLVVNPYQAPGQPSEWADSVAAQIPGSAHLVYQGPGTLAYRESPCARAAIDSFLVDLRRPAMSTCPGIWPAKR